jgi:hypothetical protein
LTLRQDTGVGARSSTIARPTRVVPFQSDAKGDRR